MSPELERQLANLPGGTHLCALGETADERVSAAAAFVKVGLMRGERAIYLAAENTLAEASQLLTQAGVKVAEERRRGALQLLTPTAAGILPPGEFARAAETAALTAGFTGARWVLERAPVAPGPREAETQLDGLGRSSILCLYDRTAGRPADLHGALCTHSWAVCGGRLCINPFCEPPDLVHDPQRPEVNPDFLRRQVAWRLAQLQRLQNAEQERWRLEQALRAREESVRVQLAELEQIYRHAPVGLCFVDRDLRFVRFNEQLAAIAGKPVHEIIGRTVREVDREVAPDLGDADERRYRQVIETGEPLLNLELSGQLATQPGVQRHWLVNYCPLRAEDGTVLGAMTSTVEITEHKRAQAELQRQKELLQKVFDQLPVMVSFWDADGQVRQVNRHWEQVLGWTLAEALQHDILTELIPDPADRERSRNNLLEPPSGWLDFRLRVRDGRWLETSWALVTLSDGTRVAIGQDVTEGKRVEAELREFAERVQALSRRLLTVQEDERRHLARELHDEIGQGLTGLQFALDSAADLSLPAARPRLREARQAVDGLLAKVRLLSFDLRPAILDHLGLLPALLWLFERYTARTQVRVHFRHEGLQVRFAPTVETSAYRIIQESLTNAARHAGVAEVAVRVWAQGGLLHLQVEDEGRGFNPEAVLASGATSGLAGMQERVQLLGGQLVIDSSPGAGAQLMIRLPVGE